MAKQKQLGTGAAAALSPELHDVRGVAELLNCSTRHVYRLCDSGKMPRPIKLGMTLNRWSREVIDNWIAQGCPNCRTGGGR